MGALYECTPSFGLRLSQKQRDYVDPSFCSEAAHDQTGRRGVVNERYATLVFSPTAILPLSLQVREDRKGHKGGKAKPAGGAANLR